MPVLLHASEYDQWLHDSFDDLLPFQAPRFPDDLRNNDHWVKRRF